MTVVLETSVPWASIASATLKLAGMYITEERVMWCGSGVGVYVARKGYGDIFYLCLSVVTSILFYSPPQPSMEQ